MVEGVSSLSCSTTRVTGIDHHTRLLCGCWEFDLRPSSLYGKYFIHRAIFLTPNILKGFSSGLTYILSMMIAGRLDWRENRLAGTHPCTPATGHEITWKFSLVISLIKVALGYKLIVTGWPWGSLWLLPVVSACSYLRPVGKRLALGARWSLLNGKHAECCCSLNQSHNAPYES